MQNNFGAAFEHSDLPEIPEEERAAVLEGLGQAEHGEFVPDDVVAAYFAKHRG